MRTEVPELLTVEEVAQKLNLTEVAVYHMVARHEIPHFKLGRKIRFADSAILLWLERQKVESNNETG